MTEKTPNEKMAIVKELLKTVWGKADGLETAKRGWCYMCTSGKTCVWIHLRAQNKALVEITTEGAPGAVGVVYDLETMLPDDEMTQIHTRGERGQRLRDWVSEIGAESCIAAINRVGGDRG